MSDFPHTTSIVGNHSQDSEKNHRSVDQVVQLISSTVLFVKSKVNSVEPSYPRTQPFERLTNVRVYYFEIRFHPSLDKIRGNEITIDRRWCSAEVGVISCRKWSRIRKSRIRKAGDWTEEIWSRSGRGTIGCGTQPRNTLLTRSSSRTSIHGKWTIC